MNRSDIIFSVGARAVSRIPAKSGSLATFSRPKHFFTNFSSNISHSSRRVGVSITLPPDPTEISVERRFEGVDWEEDWVTGDGVQVAGEEI